MDVVSKNGGEPKTKKKGKHVQGAKGDRYERVGFKFIRFKDLANPDAAGR